MNRIKLKSKSGPQKRKAKLTKTVDWSELERKARVDVGVTPEEEVLLSRARMLHLLYEKK